MRVELLNQYAGRQTAADRLCELLDRPEFLRFRALMAFCRGPGVGLLADALHRFGTRGGRAEFIVGVDLGGTSPDALDALATYGDCFIFSTGDRRTFHPKVVILDDGADPASHYGVLVGSNNWTLGGLDSNFEAGLYCEAVRDRTTEETFFADSVEELWSTYRVPKEPMTLEHLRAVDAQLIHEIAERLPRDESQHDARESALAGMFPPLDAPWPVRRRPRRNTAAAPGTTVVEAALPRTLLLEAGRETGQGREIQLPLDVLTEYFGVARDDAYYMTFEHGDGSTECNRPLAQHPSNSTFRISSAKFQAVPYDERPMIVRLDRKAPDTFCVSIYRARTAGCVALEPHLTRGGGGTKRWGLIQA